MICRLRVPKFTSLLNHSCNLLSNTLALSQSLVDFNRVPRNFSHLRCGFPAVGAQRALPSPSQLLCCKQKTAFYSLCRAMFIFILCLFAGDLFI